MKQSLIFVFIAVLLSSCFRRKLPGSCINIACTNEYKMLTVAIIDSNNQPFYPQKLESIIKDSIINVSNSPILPNQNAWLILGDDIKEKLGVNIENTMIVKTYTNNKVRSIDTFIVKADCCHIQKLSGKDTLKIK